MGLCINIASFFYIEKQIEKIKQIECIAKVISIKEEKEYTNKYIVKVLELNENYNIKNIKLIIYLEKDINFLPGDIVYIKGEISSVDSKRNYGGFDYKTYLKQFKIFGIIQAEDCRKVSKQEDLYCILENVRYKFLTKIENLYNNENSGFLKSLLFGKTDGITDTIKESFRDSSLSHVLAISGMHVTYVVLGIKFILDKLIKNKKIKNNTLIFCIIFFSFVTGNSVSGIRACIMSAMTIFANNFERKSNFYFCLIYSFLIIILLNPYNIFNIGLWLSYMGSLGIVCFSSFFKKYIYRKVNFKKKTNIIFEKIREYIIENFVVTLSAQILIFPIMMYVFNTISISFFISNILISVFVGPLLILGYISVLLSFVYFPPLKLIVYVLDFLIFIVIKISEICSRLPFSKIYVTTPNIATIFIYYGIAFLLIYIFFKKRFYFLRIIISKRFFKRELIKINEKILVFKKHIIIVFVIVVIIIVQIRLNNYSILQINFIDVGQGDCTYIKTFLGKNIIIDGGEGNTEKYDYGENVVLPYLLDRKVKKIDYLIISHTDSDHIGGLFAVIENIKIDKILIGIQPQISEQYVELLELSKEKNIKIVELKAGNRLKIEKEIYLDVLWPKANNFIESNALNNNSLVFKIYYKNFSILFTGDVEEIAEKEILNLYKDNLNILNSTILKAAHHGSKTSTSLEFLNSVNPQIVLIGAGKDNKFGHPSKSVINRLKKKNIKIYRTDKNGEINIIFTQNRISVKALYE